MRYIKLYEQFRIFEAEDIKDIPVPSKQVLLDGTSSSGKSAALKGLSADWCVLAVDSFYNLMYEEAGNEDFGNKDKPKISEVYPDCPYKTSRGTEDFEKSARWFMAKKAK